MISNNKSGEQAAAADSSFTLIPRAELRRWAETTQPRHYRSLTEALAAIYDAGDAMDVEALARIARRKSGMVRRVALNAKAGVEAGSRYDSTTDAYTALKCFFEVSGTYASAFRLFWDRHKSEVRP